MLFLNPYSVKCKAAPLPSVFYNGCSVSGRTGSSRCIIIIILIPVPAHETLPFPPRGQEPLRHEATTHNAQNVPFVRFIQVKQVNKAQA